MRTSPLRRVSTDPKKKAVIALDRVFSKMIRERDAELGCITCGRTGQMDAGHFRPRGLMSTRWNPMNVNGQCLKCNRFDSKGYEYGVALDKKWVRGTARILYRVSKEIKQWSITELEQMADACRKGYPVFCQIYNEYMPIK